MCQTLFTIPQQIAGVNVFGFGWLLGLWAIGTVLLVGWSLVRRGWNGETRGQLGAALVIGLAIAFILPNLMDERLGGLAIRGYGALLLVAVASGVGLSMYRAQRVGVNPEIILSLGTWFFIWGIVGARAFYVIEYWDRFQRPTVLQTVFSIINLTQGGLVVYGSLLAGGAALIVFVRKYRLPGLALADLIAPGVVLGVGLGRLGCFMNGCCYGGLSDLPWAVQFPPESPAYADQVESGTLYVHGLAFDALGTARPVIARVEPDSPAEMAGLHAGDTIEAIGRVPVKTVHEAQGQLLRVHGEGAPLEIQLANDPQPRRWTISGVPPRSRPVHPAQLYSFFDALLLCGLVLAFEPYKRRDGELTALVLTLHPISRFLLEIIRIDESAVFGTGMSISQNISIGIFLGGIALWIYLLRKPPGIAWQPRMAPSTASTPTGVRPHLA
jgi:phosphatidylglycerol:prolipoprotein diacylglycerol transferase